MVDRIRERMKTTLMLLYLSGLELTSSVGFTFFWSELRNHDLDRSAGDRSDPCRRRHCACEERQEEGRIET